MRLSRTIGTTTNVTMYDAWSVAISTETARRDIAKKIGSPTSCNHSCTKWLHTYTHNQHPYQPSLVRCHKTSKCNDTPCVFNLFVQYSTISSRLKITVTVGESVGNIMQICKTPSCNQLYQLLVTRARLAHVSWYHFIPCAIRYDIAVLHGWFSCNTCTHTTTVFDYTRSNLEHKCARLLL